jgi:hypothetical protein
VGARLFNLAILLFAAGFVAEGAFVEELRWINLRFPLLIGAAIVSLCSIEHLLMRREATAGPERPKEAPRTREAVRGMLIVLGALPTIWTLGYAAGLPLYVLTVLRLHGHGWGLSAAVAAGGFAITYLGFAQLLRVPLPILPEWL